MRIKGFWDILGTQVPVEADVKETKVIDALNVGREHTWDSPPENAWVLGEDLRKILGVNPYTLFVDLMCKSRVRQYATWKSTDCQDATVETRNRYVDMANYVLRHNIDGGTRRRRVIDNPHRVPVRKVADICLRLVRLWKGLCQMDKLDEIRQVEKVIEPECWFASWASAVSVFHMEMDPHAPTERIDEAVVHHYYDHVAGRLASIQNDAAKECKLPRPPEPQPEPEPEPEQAPETGAPLQLVPEGGVMDEQLGGRRHYPIKGHALVVYELVFDASKSELEGCLALTRGKFAGCDITIVGENVINVTVESDIVDGWPASASETQGAVRAMHGKADTVYRAIDRLLETARSVPGGDSGAGAVH